MPKKNGTHTAYVVQAHSPEHAIALVQAGYGLPAVFGGPGYGGHVEVMEHMVGAGYGALASMKEHMAQFWRPALPNPLHMPGLRLGAHAHHAHQAVQQAHEHLSGAFAMPELRGHCRGGDDDVDHVGQDGGSLFCPSGCWNGWWVIGLGALGFFVGGLLGWQVASAMQLGTAAGKALPALLPAL